MPFASLLHDRFLAASARGRGHLDWSAIALSVAEDAGVGASTPVAPAGVRAGTEGSREGVEGGVAGPVQVPRERRKLPARGAPPGKRNKA